MSAISIKVTRSSSCTKTFHYMFAASFELPLLSLIIQDISENKVCSVRLIIEYAYPFLLLIIMPCLLHPSIPTRVQSTSHEKANSYNSSLSAEDKDLVRMWENYEDTSSK